MSDVIQIRRVQNPEIRDAFRIMKQLRSSQSLKSFKSFLASQHHTGYQLFGAFEDGELLGLAGFRLVSTLARGNFLHLDDLVVDEKLRVQSVGRALMDFVYSYATMNKMNAVFLDARPEAIGFYEKLGYMYHSSPSMNKMLDTCNG